ncbi:hypothetical protein [Rathayibacter sp. VKM Ac-2805]|uniref:hypothetical protein n=1 Tax=Rathayibacter sp. VKM Ac-2805 TaxID=2609258 RepID=UPI001320261F|nr:hypothetical protein [Rathayibacter sp. VKM Ac-2805]QHC73770.1 hypothetical protein GSU40_08835 [Rathayibacter sp. VKM Ac-2805]
MIEWWGNFSEWLTGTRDIRQWDWGSTADWVTGLLTALAVLVPFLIFRSENKRFRSEQARLLFIDINFNVVGPEGEDVVEYTVRNNSDRPLAEIELYVSVSGDVQFEYILKAANELAASVMALLKSRRFFTILIGSLSFAYTRETYRLLTSYRYARSSAGDIEPGNDVLLVEKWISAPALVAVSFRDASGVTWMREARSGEFLSERRRKRVVRQSFSPRPQRHII